MLREGLRRSEHVLDVLQHHAHTHRLVVRPGFPQVDQVGHVEKEVESEVGLERELRLALLALLQLYQAPRSEAGLLGHLAKDLVLDGF